MQRRMIFLGFAVFCSAGFASSAGTSCASCARASTAAITAHKVLKSQECQDGNVATQRTELAWAIEDAWSLGNRTLLGGSGGLSK